MFLGPIYHPAGKKGADSNLGLNNLMIADNIRGVVGYDARSSMVYQACQTWSMSMYTSQDTYNSGMVHLYLYHAP